MIPFDSFFTGAGDTVHALRLLERVHGHAGWLAAAVLVHPALVLRVRGRSAPFAVGSSLVLTTFVFAVGAALYGDYRLRLKQSIFVASPAMGWLFERKEHLGVLTLCLTWSGALAYVAARRARGTSDHGDHVASLLERTAFRAFVAAAMAAIATAASGTIVSAFRSF